MKKIFTLIAAALVLFMGACKKSETVTPDNSSSGNSYTVNGTSYNVVYTGVTNVGGKYSLIFADRTPVAGEFNFLTVKFKAAPTTGTYTVVTMAGDPPIANANECQIGASNNAAIGYGYIGAGTAPITIQVTVTGGKAKIVIPEITVQQTPSNANVKLSGTIQEI
jgi:hypothetical protein